MDPDLLSEIVIAIDGAAVFFFLMLTVIAALAAKLYAFGTEIHGSHISALDGVPSSVSLQKSRSVIANTSLENVSRPRTGHDAEVSMDLSFLWENYGEWRQQLQSRRPHRSRVDHQISRVELP